MHNVRWSVELSVRRDSGALARAHACHMAIAGREPEAGPQGSAPKLGTGSWPALRRPGDLAPPAGQLGRSPGRHGQGRPARPAGESGWGRFGSYPRAGGPQLQTVSHNSTTRGSPLLAHRTGLGNKAGGSQGEAVRSCQAAPALAAGCLGADDFMESRPALIRMTERSACDSLTVSLRHPPRPRRNVSK
jgi:hypothetical protein